VKTEQPALLQWMQPDRAQQRLAVIVASVLLAGLVATTPFLGVRFSRLDGYVPVVDTILFFIEGLTAVLLYSIYSILGARALLALASGYLFAALLIIPHALTFRGAFAPQGLLHAGEQTSCYIYLFWHLGLPSSALAYGLLLTQDPEGGGVRRWAAHPILISAAIVVALVVACTWLALHADSLFPPMMIDDVESNGAWAYFAALMLVVEAAAMWVIWRRMVSVLDLWILVALWAWFIETLLMGTTGHRFSLVWYVARCYGIVGASLVFCCLTVQSSSLYARLVVSILAQRRERENRFLSVDAALGLVAHEIRQPLSAIILNSSAGHAEMGRTDPNLGELHAIFSDIVADSHRISDIIGTLRTALKEREQERESVDLGLLVDEVLDSLGTELRHRKISVEVDLHSAPLPVLANKMQLRQVLVNLVTNAIEAMDGVDAARLFVRARNDGNRVVVEVEDRGPGIAIGSAQLVFDTFYTTKATGTGLGLSICRMIVENHGGRLSTEPARPHGTIFRFSLPAAEVV
jgi:signal transduction histidine kinase